MELNIQGKNLELNEKTRDYISKKMDRLGRHLPGTTGATIELARQNTQSQDHRVVVQITLDIEGTVLRGEERGANAMAAIDSVISVLDRRIERYKGKSYKSKKAKKAGKNLSIRTLDVDRDETEVSDEDEIMDASGRVVRVKRFPVKPMTVDDAAFQMELLGHSFFLFLNSDTDDHNVLYRRRDGDYGLMQPEAL